MTATRDQIISTTSDLLETQGYHATGLNQIIKESGAAKGSLYYYFPDGKEGLVAEAVERQGRLVTERLKAGLAGNSDAGEAIRSFINNIAKNVEASGYRAGGPLTTVALETATSSERLNETCRAAYQLIQEAFAAKLLECGYAKKRGGQLATFITAAIEGGIILSRTNHSADPLRRVADEVGRLLQAEGSV
jgi:TetR/AcrR family transcriptional regulator, lmrAB and yxaGH operons repressor